MIITAELFKKFLIESWKQTPVKQIYRVPQHSKERAVLGDRFEAESLEECFFKYSWGGKNYSQNIAELVPLRESLNQAITARDACEAKSAAFAIYDWGNVKYRSNSSGMWFERNHATGQLLGKLSDSVELLISGSALSRFDGIDLIMNSGYTKVVSLMSEEKRPLIIMDGRVGAALGDLAMIAMESGNYSKIDSSIIFPWGAARSTHSDRKKPESRDPSANGIRFPRLFGTNRHHRHAEAMFRASMLIRDVVAALQAEGFDIDARMYEAALFMWGYNVRERRSF